MKVKVNANSFLNVLRDNKTLADKVIEKAVIYFTAHTPKDSGNARSHTFREGTKIIADYPYAQKLDEGYSSQDLDGMTKPTIEYIKAEVERQLKGKK
jgi:hypothetical protein